MNTLNTAGDLAGNIKLGVDNEMGAGMMPMMMMQGQNMMNGLMPGMQPGQQDKVKSSTLPPEFRGLDTLDEPVCDTIVSNSYSLSYAKEKRSCQNLVQTSNCD